MNATKAESWDQKVNRWALVVLAVGTILLTGGLMTPLVLGWFSDEE